MNTQLLIDGNTTTQALAVHVANCFVDLDRPEGPICGSAKILTSSENIHSLAFGERPNAVGLIDVEGYGIALIKLTPNHFDLLQKIYRAVGMANASEFFGTHSVSLVPVQVWLPVAS